MPSIVIQTSFLGDMVLTTPLLARLSESGEVDVVATPASAGLLANHPSVRRVIAYDKRGTERGPVGFLRLATRLRHEGYSHAYMAQGSMRSAALALTAGVAHRVGFDSSDGRMLYNDRVPYVENDHHSVRLLSLARARIGAQSEPSPRPRLYPGETEIRAVNELLGRTDRGTPIFALAPGSVWATKRWPGFPALAALLGQRGTVITIGSAADRELAEAIGVAAGPAAIDATGRLSLLASAELIRRARVLVTNDSLPLHLASAMNTPTVAIFGPTVPAFGFGPLADRSSTVGIDTLACRPCDRHGPVSCPLRHWKCMIEVGAPSVFDVVEKLTS